MNIAAVLAALVQLGVCAPTQFHGNDGSELTVLVCPILQHSAAGAPSDAPNSPPDDVPSAGSLPRKSL